MSVKNIHFIGIGGIGISALARIYNEKGCKISGSDMEDSELLNDLKKEGIEAKVGHDTKNIPGNCDLVVYSEAIPLENPEMEEARRRGIERKTYFEALGELSEKYEVIAVCGTHGKTTVTAMTAKVLMDAGFDPTVVIGTRMQELGNKNYRLGKSRWLIVEACEYRRSFLHLYPNIIILTNLEYEHPDYYKDITDYIAAFDRFFSKLPENGKLIRKSPKINFDLKIPGDFNKENAGLVMELAEYLEINPVSAKKSLQNFKGTWRRLEVKKKIGETILIDDYAHHPTEIQASLGAVREKWPGAKILCVFQPHQYSRTRKLLNAFAKSFTEADSVIIPNIYKVRDTEQDISSITPESFVETLKKKHPDTRYGDGLEKTTNYVKKNLQKYDIVITMGAGDVWKIGKAL